MIFVTVGTQIPFDRMVRTIDDWAGSSGRGDVFAQIGPGAFEPRNMKWSVFLDATEFKRRVAIADVVIAHAGMGSIITALELGKPIIVMPRLAALREHRNDHQLATARRFLAQGRIDVAFDESELLARLNHLQEFQNNHKHVGISPSAAPELLEVLQSFIHMGVPVKSGSKHYVTPISLARTTPTEEVVVRERAIVH